MNGPWVRPFLCSYQSDTFLTEGLLCHTRADLENQPLPDTRGLHARELADEHQEAVCRRQREGQHGGEVAPPLGEKGQLVQPLRDRGGEEAGRQAVGAAGTFYLAGKL